MQAVKSRVLVVFFCATAVLPAQTQADTRPLVDSAVAQQRASAAAMQESVAQQRSSVQKQTRQSESGSFFILAPPARLGVNAPAPATAAASAAPDCEPLPPSEVDSLVEQVANRQGLDQALLHAVVQQESAFRPCAVSPKGAMGLMQLMPATAGQLEVFNPFDPAANLEAGARFLKELLVRYGGDVPRALGAYNAGSAKVDAAAGVPEIPETKDYINRILSNLPVKKQP